MEKVIPMIKQLALITLIGTVSMQAASSTTTTTATTRASHSSTSSSTSSPRLTPRARLPRFNYQNATLKNICLYAIAQELARRTATSPAIEHATTANTEFTARIEHINAELNNELIDELYAYIAIKIILDRALPTQEKRTRLNALRTHLENNIADPAKTHSKIQNEKALAFITILVEKILPYTPRLTTIFRDVCTQCDNVRHRKLIDFATHSGCMPAYRALQLLNSPEPLETHSHLITHDHFGLLDLIVQEHPEINCNNLFFAAARDGNITAMEMFLTHPTRAVDINALDNTGSTALMITLAKRHTQAALWLINKGAEINIKNGAGERAIHIASFYGLIEVVQALIAKESRLNPRDKYMQTPLNKACSMNQLACVQLLLEHKASVNTRDKQGDTPLHCAIGSVEILQALLAAGANINAQANDLNTPLHCALLASHKRLDVIRFLITQGARMDIPNSNRQTATILISWYAQTKPEFRTLADELEIAYTIPITNRVREERTKKCELM